MENYGHPCFELLYLTVKMWNIGIATCCPGFTSTTFGSKLHYSCIDTVGQNMVA